MRTETKNRYEHRFNPYNRDMACTPSSKRQHRSPRPKVNVYENEEMYTIELAVPGFGKEDISIEVQEMDLRIRSKEQDPASNSTANGTKIYREFGNRPFDRVFKMHSGIDQEKMEASYDKGILSVKLPKKEKFSKKITIQ